MSGARLDLANCALERVHGQGIGSFEDRGQEARLVNKHIDRAIEWVLRRNYSGASTTTDCLQCIPADDCSLPPGFCYAFALPCMYVKIVQVWSEAAVCSCKTCSSGEPVEFRRSAVKRKSCGKTVPAIISPCAGPLKVEYVYLAADDLEDLPADLLDLIEIRLAYKLAMPLRADKTLMDQLGAEYREAERCAQDTEALEDGTAYELDPGNLVRARHGWY